MRALSDAAIDAFALAADSSGIYWTTPANELWVLRTEQGAPERLAADAEAGPYCQAPSPPLLAGGFVFWLGSARSALHRTRADGSGDDVVARAVRGDNLAADAANIYWTEALGSYGQGAGAVRMLPFAAAPGAAPVTLVTAAVNEEIASLAIRDGVLYWTPFGAIGATQYNSVDAQRAGGGARGRRRRRGRRRAAQPVCAVRRDRRALLHALPQPVDDGGRAPAGRRPARRDHRDAAHRTERAKASRSPATA